VLARAHVDEVDHHQAAEVAQAHLARDFFRRFQVGVEGGFLDVAALGGARGVDVDRGQRLGLVDHDRAAGGQADLALVGVLDLRLDLEAVEQRDVVGVCLSLRRFCGITECMNSARWSYIVRVSTRISPTSARR
jgi:hypothetical protein